MSGRGHKHKRKRPQRRKQNGILRRLIQGQTLDAELFRAIFKKFNEDLEDHEFFKLEKERQYIFLAKLQVMALGTDPEHQTYFDDVWCDQSTRERLIKPVKNHYAVAAETQIYATCLLIYINFGLACYHDAQNTGLLKRYDHLQRADYPTPDRKKSVDLYQRVIDDIDMLWYGKQHTGMKGFLEHDAPRKGLPRAIKKVARKLSALQRQAQQGIRRAGLSHAQAKQRVDQGLARSHEQLFAMAASLRKVYDWRRKTHQQGNVATAAPNNPAAPQSSSSEETKRPQMGPKTFKQTVLERQEEKQAKMAVVIRNIQSAMNEQDKILAQLQADYEAAVLSKRRIFQTIGMLVSFTVGAGALILSTFLNLKLAALVMVPMAATLAASMLVTWAYKWKKTAIKLHYDALQVAPRQKKIDLEKDLRIADGYTMSVVYTPNFTVLDAFNVNRSDDGVASVSQDEKLNKTPVP